MTTNEEQEILVELLDVEQQPKHGAAYSCLGKKIK